MPHGRSPPVKKREIAGELLNKVTATLEAPMDIQGILGIDSDIRNGFDESRLESTGIAQVLCKPCDLGELSDAISQIMGEPSEARD